MQILILTNLDVRQFQSKRPRWFAFDDSVVHHTICAVDAAAAELASNTPHIVLLASDLPQETVTAALGMINASFPTIPVVVICRKDDADFDHRLFAHGAQDSLLETGLTSAALLRALRAGIERKRFQSSAARSEPTPPQQPVDASSDYANALQAAVQQSYDAIAITNTDHIITFVNHGFTRLTGYSADEVVGEKPTMFLDEASVSEPLIDIATRAWKTHDSRNTNVIRHKNGTQVIVEWSSTPIRRISGEIVSYITIARDITEREQTETALRASNENYYSLLESTDSAIVVFKADGQIVFTNSAAAQALGSTPSAVTGRNMRDVFPPTVAEWQLARIQEVIESSEGIILEAPTVVADGVHWYRTSIQPIRDSSGKVTAAMIHAVDITQIRETTEALRASEARFRGLIETAPEAVIITDDSGRILLVNEQAQKIFGYRPEELIGEQIETLVPEASREQHAQNYAAYVNDPKAFRGTGRFLMDGQRKDGSIFPIEIGLGYIRIDNKLTVVSFSLDVTERIRVQSTLEHQANLLNQVSDAIIATDPDLKITAWNDAAAQIYGWSASEALGQNLDELLKSAWGTGEQADAQEKLRTTGQWSGVIAQYTKVGRRLDIQASVSVLTENGQFVGGVTLNRDITARKRREILQTRIAQILEAVANGQSIANVLNMIALAVEEFEPDIRASVLLLDPATNKLRHGTAPRLPDTYIKAIDGVKIGASAGSCGTAAYEKRLVIVEDIATHPYWEAFRHIALLHGLRACWSQPIFDEDDTVLGTFAMYYDTPRSPIPEEIELIALAAHITGIALRHTRAEEALRTNERRYRQTFMVHGLPKLIIDRETARIVDANSAAAQFYGYDIETLTALTIFDLSFSSHEDVITTMKHVAETGIATFNVMHRGANNTPRSVEVHGVPIDVDDKQLLYLNIIDVTDKERAKAALQEAHDLLEQRVIDRTAELERVKNRLEAIFDHSGDGILLLSVTDGIQQANRAFAMMFGITADSYTGMKLSALVHVDDVEAVESTIAAIANTHGTRTLAVRAKRDDNTIFEAEISLAPVNRSEEAIVNMVCIVRDVTERHAAQMMIAEERNLLRTVIDAVPDLIYVKDRQHRIMLNNAAHLMSLGKTRPEDAIGKTDYELHTTDLAEKFFTDDQALLESGTPLINAEEKTVGWDGIEIWALTTKMPLRNLEGEIVGLVGITHDITHLKESEDALRRSQADLRSVIDSTNTAFLLMDRDGTLRAANRIAQAIHRLHFGYEMQLGRAMRTYIPPEHRATYDQQFEKILSGASVVTEEVLPNTDKPRYYEFRYFPVRTADGEIIGVTAAYEDITERKDAEAVLKQKHQEELVMQSYLKALHKISIELAHAESLDEFYRTVVELGAAYFGFERIGLVLYDSESHLASGTYGIGMDGSLQDQHHLVLNEEKLPSTFKQTMDRGALVILKDDVQLYEGSTPLTRGSSAAAALWDGALLGWLAVDNAIHHVPLTHLHMDILALYALTVGSLLARKRAEQTAVSLTRRLDIATRSAGIGIWEWDLRTNTLEGDDQMHALAGLVRAASTFPGEEIARFVHPDDLEHARADLDAAIEEGRPYYSEFRIVRLDRQILHVRNTGIVIFDGAGKAVQIIGATWDMTTLKESEKVLRDALERERELGELKSRFVSMASHEFRTPLAAISATTDTLAIYRQRMSEEQIDTRLEKIRQQVTHMRDITDDVLQLARIQAGRVECVPTEGNYDALCRDIVEEFESQALYRGRILYTSVNPSVIGLYDVHLLRQVITNLISNALKYSPAGTPVRIVLDHDSTAVRLSITDEGIGIPAEDQKHLFEPFHRARNVGTIPGTGLGLSIAKQSVEMHGGTIQVATGNGAGTVFTVTMPKNPPIPAPSEDDSDPA